MLKNKSMILLATGVLSFGLIGCGGGSSTSGGGSSSTSGTTNGHFKDANVQGANYKSGSHEGLTGPKGEFVCENGKNVTFSIGKIVLGNSPCDKIVTPVDLVPNGDLNNPTVQNITSFLITLDENDNPNDGIVIPEDVRKNASAVSTFDINFSDEKSVVKGISDIAKEDPSAVEKIFMEKKKIASDHLKNTVLCAYSGGFKGSWSGKDEDGESEGGPLGYVINPGDGKVTIFAYDPKEDEGNLGKGFIEIKNSNKKFNGYIPGGGIVFDGQYKSVDLMTGTWKEQGKDESGTWNTHRIAGDPDAEYRIVGETWIEGDPHLFVCDIFDNNKVSGVAYDLYEDKPYKFSGNYDPSSMRIQATAENGKKIEAMFNSETKELYDNLYIDGNNLYIEGSGCQLN
jgi:hypothetical protein